MQVEHTISTTIQQEKEPIKKIKVMVISDHLLSPSGVGSQTRHVVDALYDSGKFSFVYLGGAVKHNDYQPVRYDKYGDDLILYPVDGYGSPEIVRSLIKLEKPDILFFMTDPRFYEWLWMIENEIRPLIPLVYFHVWDNFPTPKYNKKYLESNDFLITISKVTDQICKEVAPDVPRRRLGHTANTDIFKKLGNKEEMKGQILPQAKGKFLLFYNGRNARRKMVGTALVWFRDFLNIVGDDKACFCLHTDPKDPNGPDLYQIIRDFDLDRGQVMFSTQVLNEHQLAQLYNVADLVVSISDAEGWGLCLSSSTIINTYSKAKKIIDVKIGEKVMSHDGTFHEVLAKNIKYDKTYKIKSVGNSYTYATKEHPFLVGEDDDGNLKWKKTEDLVIGDRLLVPKPKWDNKLPDFIDLTEWTDCEFDDNHVWKEMGYSGINTSGLSIADLQNKYGISKHYAEMAKRYVLGKSVRRKSQKVIEIGEQIKKDGIILNNGVIKINRFIPVDDDFLEFVGWYLAEGSNNAGNGIELDLHLKEINIAHRFSDYFKEKWGVISPKVGTKTDSLLSRLMISSQIISEFFGRFCGVHSHNKRIHPTILYSPKHLSGLVRSIFDGDGYYRQESITMRITSRHLVYQIRNILAANNIYSCIEHPPKQEERYKNIFSLGIFGEHHSRFCDWVGVPNEYHCSRKRANSIIEDEKYFYTPIRSIELTDDVREVVDIQVATTQNFMANGVVVHNCAIESLACETPICVTYGGGLQEQVTDGKNWFGKGIKPASKMIVGAQNTPYIFEDRIAKEDFLKALKSLYKTWKNKPEEYAKMGENGRKHVLKEYGYEKFRSNFVETMLEIHETNGSWETRKNYKSWEMFEK